MGKKLSCRDVGVDCDFVAKGKDEADILSQVAAHAKKCHSGVKVTPELQGKIKAAIKSDDSCCGGGSSCS